jgi:6-phosphogluconolactonase
MKAILIATFALVAGTVSMNAKHLLVFVGSYADSEDRGISVYRMCQDTGSLTQLSVLGNQKNPAFLEVHPSGKFLYAVNETSDFDGKKQGAVSAYSIDTEKGELTFLNQQPSKGAGPCHITIDSTGRNALIANYGGGSVACLRIGSDGKISASSSFIQHKGSSVNERRQQAPHGHSINIDPANQFAFAADLGIDKVLVYRLDVKKGKLKPHGYAKVAPGSGPRHLAFRPDGKFAYVINEMLSNVTAFRYDGKGGLTDIQTISTLPTGYKGNNSTAEIRVHPTGKFLYGSNRGHDSIAVFRIHPKLGTLIPVEEEKTGGKTPRNINITPDGKHLLAANQNSGNIVVFEIDQETGELNKTDNEVETPKPVCIRFLEVD